MARRKPTGRRINGWLVIDKGPSITSTQVVAEVKRLTQAQKVGHGGTLDPLATGVLPIAMGEATKTVAYVMDSRKSYEFTLRFTPPGMPPEDDRPDFFTAIQEQLGLRLEATRAPVDTFVIDHIERPTAN